MRNADLAKYYPDIMKEVREFQQISTVENPEFNLVWNAINDCLDDQFILDSTENGVSRREIPLKITPKQSDTLGERKFRLLARYNEDIPYTVPALYQKLNALCGKNGYRLNLIHNTFTLIVKVELVAKKNLEAVGEMLERIVPQNMVIDLDLMYNQHQTFQPFAHRQLQEHKHLALRNEVIT